MKFDRVKFFQGFRPWYKAETGLALAQDKVDALEFLLSQFESDPAWTAVPEVAYALATIHIETFWPKSGKRYEPIVEGGSNAYFKKYDGRDDLGNNQPGDGLRFKGRGYVQITGRKNYTKFTKLLNVDLLGNPNLALDPVISFKIMSIGMFNGIFTGKKLGTYVSATKKDYVKARGVINGNDRAREIAGYADVLEDILAEALITGVVETVPVETVTAQPVQLVEPVVEVELISATSTDSNLAHEEGTLTKIGNKLNAAYTAAGTAAAGMIAWFSSSPAHIIYAVMGAVALLGITYMIINALRANSKEKQEALARVERERLEAELKLQRDRQAFELQKLTIQSAMHKDLNTVKLVTSTQLDPTQ